MTVHCGSVGSILSSFLDIGAFPQGIGTFPEG
jgi:hypothetical protein